MNTWMLTMKYVDSTDILDYFGLYTMGFTPKLAIKSSKPLCYPLELGVLHFKTNTHTHQYNVVRPIHMLHVLDNYFHLPTSQQMTQTNMSEHTTVHKNHKTHGKEYTTPHDLPEMSGRKSVTSHPVHLPETMIQGRISHIQGV
jgi:hypothetical protein